ncbi:MAG: N-acetylmuramoyl-L-alanine amidase, partial [Alphaproteobacteria bacterium]|nr:N-acetylmuramoyl-L-alanine amidase [Alphaproteobacteria bacterium]
MAAEQSRSMSKNLKLAANEAPSQSEAGNKDKIPQAGRGQISQFGELTRLTFDISQSVPVTAFVLTDPKRVIIDLPEVSFAPDPVKERPTGSAKPGQSKTQPNPKSGVILTYRSGLFAPGKSRIVIDLADPARISRAVVEKKDDNQGLRLIIELALTDPATFAKEASLSQQSMAKAATNTPAQKPQGPESKPLVVLDPGHGGIDAGAHGANAVLEKDIVFEFAKTLAAQLRQEGKYRVLLTRNQDVFVPLAERVRIARSAGADLFLSIHADIISDGSGVSGATIYTMSDRASDAQAARVAEKENMSDTFAGLDSKEERGGINDILFDLTRRETRRYSQHFSHTLTDYLKDHMRLNKNPQRSAGFQVLKAPDVPSVLLEIGYLSNDKDLV